MPLLNAWVPGWPAMRTLTALGMLGTAAGMLLAAASRWPEWRIWRRQLAGASMAVACVPLGLGCWVLFSWLSGRAWNAGRASVLDFPSPAAGLCLMFFGLALMTVRWTRALLFFSFCAGSAAALGWLALLSLLYGSDPGAPNLLFGTVSLPASLVMLLLSMGLAFLRPREGMVKIMSSHSVTGRLVRQLLPLTLLLAFVFGLVRLWAQHFWGFTTEFGAAFSSTVTTVLLTLVILHHAQTVERENRLRGRAERRVAKRLAQQEQRFRGIFDHAFQFIGLLTPQGMILETNESSLTATGVTAQDVIGKNLWECPWWSPVADEQARLRNGVQRAAAGELVHFQTEYRAADGSWRPLDFSLNAVINESGGVAFLVSEGRDVMVHQQVTRNLENITQRLRLATQAADIGIWDWDVVASHFIWDELMHQIYQLPSNDARLPYEVWEACLHPDDRDATVSLLQDALAGRDDFDMVFRILWPDGSVHYIQAKAIVQRDPDGKPLRMLGTNADITKQVMAEAGLHESEERFRHAFEYSAIGFALLEPDGTWLTMNRALCDIVGYSEGELLGRSFQEITHPADLEKDLENVNRLILGEITHYQMEKRYVRKDGSIVWGMLTASLVKEEDGSPAYFISQVEDITQRHEAERILKYQQEQLRMLIEHTPAAVAMFDLDMRYMAASRRWTEDYHLQSEPLLGRRYYEVFPEIGAEWQEIHRRSLAGAVVSRDEDMFVRKDGQVEWLRWEVRPWMEAGGEIGGLVMFTEVITERKRAAEKIRASLEEKEVLLREIHHRVKNNMQIISSLLQLQTSALHDPADVTIFQDCQTRIHAMAMVHDRLYRSGNLSTINFGEHLHELANLMARGQASSMRHIRLESECEDVELELDKAIPLGLIATELITNAFKHAFTGREEGVIRVSLQRPGPAQMLLRVSDDGKGLPPGADPVSARTLGLRLVRSLSHQLRARILFPATSAGCCVELTFDV